MQVPVENWHNDNVLDFNNVFGAARSVICQHFVVRGIAINCPETMEQIHKDALADTVYMEYMDPTLVPPLPKQNATRGSAANMPIEQQQPGVLWAAIRTCIT
jgi:hypothetical protein